MRSRGKPGTIGLGFDNLGKIQAGTHPHYVLEGDENEVEWNLDINPWQGGLPVKRGVLKKQRVGPIKKYA